MDVASLFTKVKRSYNIQHDLKTQQSDIISQILEHRCVWNVAYGVWQIGLLHHAASDV
jgi:hypothetical protein